MNTDPPQKRPLERQAKAVVIGASSGIGAALARSLGADGYALALVARREAKLRELSEAINRGPGTACYYTHNVTHYQEVPVLFQQIASDLDGLDLIIYVAGADLAIAPDEYEFEKDQRMIDVNLSGAIAWLNQAAIRFQRAGSGHIVGIGSVAGDRGRRAKPAYHASKAGLHTYLESLRNRLSQYGVTVTTVKPGMVKTKLLEQVDKQVWPISAEEAAAQIMKSVKRRRQTVYVPGRWRWVMLVIRHMPSFIFRRLNF